MSARRGVFIVLVVLGLLGLGVLVAALRLRGTTTTASDHAVVSFDVPALLPESEAPFQPFALRRERREPVTLFDVLTGLRAAAEDDHVDVEHQSRAPASASTCSPRRPAPSASRRPRRWA